MEQLNLRLTLNQNGSITANWSAISGAVRYSVMMYPVGKSYAIYNETNFTGTSYTSRSNLEDNQQYKVTVVAYGSSASITSDGVQILIPLGFYNNLPLDVPQNVSATADATSVTVSFSAVTRATSYDILFDNTVYNGTATSRRFSGLSPKSTHTYAVRAKNSSKTGAYSNTQSITTQPQTPAVPSGIKKTATETSATISWGTANAATGYDIQFNNRTYYTTSTSYTFTGLTAGSAYAFAIRSRGTDVNSAYTSQMTVTTPAKAPASISATSTSNTATISWNAVSGVSGYIVNFNNVEHHVSASNTSYTATGLTQKTAYSYQICCKSADGTGSYSTSRTVTTQAQTPAVPTNIKKVADGKTVTISWNAVNYATGYVLVFNGSTYNLSETSKTFTGLSVNTTYRFKVCAKNDAIYGNYSSEMTVVTAPGAPGSISATSTETSATVSWEAVSGAAGYTLDFNGTKYTVSSSVTSRTITGLTDNTSYSYQVCARSVDGDGVFSSTRTVKTLMRGLAVPTGFSHKVTDTSVTISWKAVSGAAGYDVYLGGRLYSTTGASIEITGLISDYGYTYRVRSKVANGTVGEYSADQSFRTSPKAPASISVSTSENSATVSWNAVTGATGYDLLFNNRTYRTTGVTYTVTGLAANTSYSYQVRSNNADGSSTYSTGKTVTTAPKAPATFTTSSTQTSVTLGWSAVSGATSYDLIFNGSTYRVSGTSRTFSYLTANTGYSYQVRSNNASGSSSYSAVRTVSTLPYPPAAPTNIKATATVNSVTITWSAVSGATSYDVQWGNNTYNVTGTSKTITGLSSDTSYTYKVRSNNAGGNGTYSYSQSVRTLLAPPTVPTNIKSTPSSYSVTVTWSSVDKATGYDLLFNGTVYSVTSPPKVIYGLNPSTSYYYQVRAKNSAGTSAYSAQYRVTTLVAPPAIPTNVTATATTNSATVRWNAVSGATGYRVLFDYTGYDTGTATSKTITGLEPGVEYPYAVCALNAGGSSGYSAQQIIRTIPVVPAVPQAIQAMADVHSVRLSWNAVSGADSYDLLFDGTVYEITGLDKIIDGLEANTVYSYQLRAKNEAGASAYCAAKTVRTRLEAPENVWAEATSKTVKISFDPVNGATSYGINFAGGIYDTTETSMLFEGLQPETTYDYAVCARYEYVDGAFSETESVMTLPLGPAMPTDVTATATMDSVIVSWSPVDEAENYDVRFDGIDYPVSASSAAAVVAQEEDAVQPMAAMMYDPGRKMMRAVSYGSGAAGAVIGGRICKVLAGLSPNTRHSYSVRACNAEGSSPYTEEQHVMTDVCKSSGLAQGSSHRNYPDGRRSYTGNDPVNALTGAFLWSRTWLEDHGKDRLHFTTMYDSKRDARQGVLGRKWTHSFNYMLRMDAEYAYFYTPYDDVTAFGRNTEDGSFVPVDGTVSSYIMETNEDGSYSVIASDGTEYVFDAGLCLKQIIENGLVSYRFQSDAAGQMTRMEGRHGAGMDITYTDGFIASVSDAMGNTVSFTYEDGRLTAITNPEDRTMSFTYDTDSNLLTISDFAGEVYLTNTYDMQGRVTEQLTAGRGRSYAAYDEENRETRFTDELGNITQYVYDEAGHITDVLLAGTSIHNSYNEAGQLIEQTDALGNSTQMEYDEYGRMNHVIHPDGTEESVTYNDRNQPSRVVGRDGAVNLYRYDERNNLIEMQDERGNTSSYTYDENDNLTAFTDRSGNIWTYAYDGSNHLEQAADPDGNICSYTHDAIGRMTSYTSPAGRTISYRYSAAGDLLSMEDADGEIIFAYNENGNRTGITDRMGNQQHLEYNEMGQVSLATDCLGNEYQFTYDEKGNLITETDPLGYSVSRTYDAFGNRTSQTDKNGGNTLYYFDAANQLIQVRDAAGGTVSYTYDCMGRVVTVTDQLSHTKTYAYDQAGRVLSETDALEHSVGYTYDEAGNLLTKTDEDGNVTSYTYDAENRLKSIQTDAGTTTFTYDKLGRIISVTDTDGYEESAQYDRDGNRTAVTDKEGRETTYVYDSMGRISEETAPNGGKKSYVYDKNGNCVQVTDAEGHITGYEYDANNRPVKIIDPLGRETAFAYDGRGQMVRVTDANGGVTAYSYDGNGNLTAEVNPLGGEKTYTYDSLNRLIGSTDEEGNTWSCTYDAAGNRTSRTDANGNCWIYAYDANNRLISVTDQNEGSLTFEYTNTGRIASVTDMEGAATGYQYDTMGRLIQISDAMGHSMAFTYDSTGRLLSQTDANGNITEYTYSPAGSLLSVKDPEDNTTAYTYNALGQVLTKTDALGNTISYTYDLLGQVTTMTDALGNQTAFTYTADGRVATVENAEGSITRYTYDACGNLTRTEDALGNVVLYEYDAMNNRIRECLSEGEEQNCITLYWYDKKGRMIREINPLLEEKAYGYDGNDNMVSVTDEEQRETVVTYDLNNKPVSMTYSDGRTAAFRYNKRGELVEMQDWNGTTLMERDSLGRLTGVTDHNGRMTGFTYDALGNRTGVQYPDGSAAAYAYDRNNRLLKVTEGVEAEGENAGGITAQYAYDAAGNMVSLTQPGSITSYTYNANRQPVTAAYRLGETESLTEAITYDAMGRIIGAKRSGSRAEFARTTAYAYDAIGQLVSYTNGGNVEAYTYDALGNRTTRSVNGIQKAACQYNALNQLIALSEDGVDYSFGYDRCGNLTEERRGSDLVRQYVYDATGYMTLGRNMESGEETAYTYNALQMCVKNVQKLASPDGLISRERQYIPDFLSETNNELMAYETGAGSIRTIFGHGYQRLSQNAASGKTYFQPDIYGSPLFATDGQGAIQQYAERDIWGGLKPGTEVIPGLEENLRFTSYRYDPVIGKHFAQARFYDDANGRMLALDPVKRGLNSYRYCDNDPVDYVDPTGEIWNIFIGGALGGFFGAGAGMVSSIISQTRNGGKVNWKKVLAAGVKGGITGTAQGTLLASGAGIPAALATNFLAGTAGSAAEQYIGTGEVSIRRSITDGLTNSVSNAIYGTKPISSAWNAFGRGFGAGAATSGINYLSDLLWQEPERSGAGGNLMAGMARGLTPQVGWMRDPRLGCGSESPFVPVLGYSSARGYQYETPQTGGSQRKKFSMCDFFKEIMTGGLTGGVTSVAFYGTGKGIERLKESTHYNRSDTYYHVTTEENAQQIMASGELGRRGNRWESKVFAWNRQPTRRQASIAGISSEADTVLRFQTNASFQPDTGNIGKPIEKMVVETTSAQRVPISIRNVESVGFRKEWWQFWKK